MTQRVDVGRFLRCPSCGAELGPELSCVPCDLVPDRSAGLIDFLGDGRRPVPEPAVNAFYEARPFPGYAPGDDAVTLLDRCRSSPFLRSLDEAVPPDALVLDAGCGTGQIPAFLALAGPRRTVVGVDACLASLSAAHEFQRKATIDNLVLARGNLLEMPVALDVFDVVDCRGVVHHNQDWRTATLRVARHVKPGGVLVLGFYESIARLPHRIRRGLGRVLRSPVRVFDPILRRGDIDEEKKRTWIEDQYHHPLEWCLSFTEVLVMLESQGFSYVRSVPPSPGREGMFDTLARPSNAALLARRWGWALTPGDQDAGLVGLVVRRDT